MQPIPVAVVLGQALLREILVAWLVAQDVPVRVTASSASVDGLRAGGGWGAPVVLLDGALTDGSTVEQNVHALRDAGSAVVVVADEALTRRALDAGAAGWVSMADTGTYLVQAILAMRGGEARIADRAAVVQTVGPGVPRLSAQELRALRYYAAGLPLKSVARRIGVTEGSAKSYLDRVRAKYAGCGRPASTKVDLFRRASEDGLLAGG